MRRTMLALALFSLPGLSGAADLPSTISDVTVYPDLAVVTRHARIELAEGEHDLVMQKLPARLQENSLQVFANSTGHATVLDVKARNTVQTQSSNDRINALLAQMQKLEAQQAELDDRAAVLENQREFISIIQQQAFASGKENSRPSLEDIKNLQSLSGDSLARTLTGLRAISQEKTKLDEEMAVLRAQWTQLDGERSARSKTVTVRVNMAKAGALDLKLAYAVNGAHWTPAYDARLRTADNRVDVSYFGVIRQTTGEDWKNVALTLSTAKPTMGGSAPTLQPWFVDVAPPPPPPVPPAPIAYRKPAALSQEKMQERADNAAAEGMAGGLTESAPAATQTARLQNEATSASFQITSPATLASDNSSQRVAITLSQLPVTLRYQATPALKETAYLTASAINDTPFPFLAGPMNTFLDDAYIASSALKPVLPGQPLELAMGADEGITVKRKLVNRFTESTGFSGSGKRVTYEYLLTVKNTKPTRTHITLIDQLPISRNDKITVKRLGPPESEARREDDGKLSWNWDMEPGATRNTTLKFSIDYPADLEVSGL